MTKQNKTISILVIILILVGISFLVYSGMNFYKIIKIKNKTTVVESMTDEKYTLTNHAGDPIKGIKNAQISIYLFSDYQTSKTKDILNIIDELIKKYPNDLNLVWKDLPMTTNRFAQSAALACRCAGEQDKYWEYSAELLNTEDDFLVETYQKISDKLKIDTNKFLSCYQAQKYLEDIDYNITEAYVLNIKEIPTIFINQQKFEGEITQDGLENVIKSIIK